MPSCIGASTAWVSGMRRRSVSSDEDSDLDSDDDSYRYSNRGSYRDSDDSEDEYEQQCVHDREGAWVNTVGGDISDEEGGDFYDRWMSELEEQLEEVKRLFHAKYGKFVDND